jgi:hypothetical protein
LPLLHCLRFEWFVPWLYPPNKHSKSSNLLSTEEVPQRAQRIGVILFLVSLRMNFALLNKRLQLTDVPGNISKLKYTSCCSEAISRFCHFNFVAATVSTILSCGLHRHCRQLVGQHHLLAEIPQLLQA